MHYFHRVVGLVVYICQLLSWDKYGKVLSANFMGRVSVRFRVSHSVRVRVKLVLALELEFGIGHYS